MWFHKALNFPCLTEDIAKAGGYLMGLLMASDCLIEFDIGLTGWKNFRWIVIDEVCTLQAARFHGLWPNLFAYGVKALR